MFLARAILDNRVYILIDTSATHIIDANFTRLAGLTEHHIETKILISKDSCIVCCGACFNLALLVNNEILWIDDFLVNLNANTNVFNCTLWLTSLGLTMWNFAMLKSFKKDHHTMAFTRVHTRIVPHIVFALPTPMFALPQLHEAPLVP